MNRTGPHVSIELLRYGFYPPGGGRIRVRIEPASEPARLDINERGSVLDQRARAIVVKLPPSIAERELAVVRERLGWTDEQLHVEANDNAFSPGNVLLLEMQSEHLTEVVTGVGERGVRAEQVAARAVDEAESYLQTGAPVGEHLADQLLLPLAIARGGSYTTGPLSLHTTTNIEVIKKFLDVEITAQPLGAELWRIEVNP